MKLGYLGLDNFGNYYRIDKYPRKELLDYLGYKHADKMYTDTLSGKTKHIGYIIGQHWIRIYEIHDWNGGIL